MSALGLSQPDLNETDEAERIDLSVSGDLLRAEFEIWQRGAHGIVEEIEDGAGGERKAALIQLLRIAVERLEEILRARQLRARPPS